MDAPSYARISPCHFGIGARMSRLIQNGHVYLQKYKVIAVTIIAFFGYQTHALTIWYQTHYTELQDWQNAPVVGLITAYIAALKFALEHILVKSDD